MNRVVKIMHVINFTCDKYTYQINVSNNTDEEIEALKVKHWKKGKNFIKVI